MKKNQIKIITLVLILITSILTTPAFGEEIKKQGNEENKIYVDNDGGEDYIKIQDAINSSNTGDTIYVHEGTYNEQIIVNKSITLEGENIENTVINGEKKGNVVTITANYVVITGFTIKNSGNFYHSAGIKLDSVENCHIEKNKICENKDGISIFFSEENKINENQIEDNTEDGVYLNAVSSNNLFYQNNFINNTYSNALDINNNTWYKESLKEGNYWDDYIGSDNNNDGIGDTPYNVSGGDNKDIYPLMEPYTGKQAKLKVIIDIFISIKKIDAKVKNSGDGIAKNVNLTIDVEYGFSSNQKQDSNEISSLNPGQTSDQLKIEDLKSFGPITVTITANADNAEPVETTKSGWIIGPIIILLS